MKYSIVLFLVAVVMIDHCLSAHCHHEGEKPHQDGAGHDHDHEAHKDHASHEGSDHAGHDVHDGSDHSGHNHASVDHTGHNHEQHKHPAA